MAPASAPPRTKYQGASRSVQCGVTMTRSVTSTRTTMPRRVASGAGLPSMAGARSRGGG
jgi:hypothetical protein